MTSRAANPPDIFQPRHAEVPAVVFEHFTRGEEAVQVHILRRDANLQPRVRRLGDDIAAEHVNAAGRCADQPGNHPDERALARAVGAEQTEKAAGGDVQGEAAQRVRAIAVDLFDVLVPQRRALVPNRSSLQPCPAGCCFCRVWLLADHRATGFRGPTARVSALAHQVIVEVLAFGRGRVARVSNDPAELPQVLRVTSEKRHARLTERRAVPTLLDARDHLALS